ncbi:MAG: phage baseplate assembly protein V [Burkholderiales bacterium]|nr:phage baseplate assembly protein V [Burkholderiales bacterium]
MNRIVPAIRAVVRDEMDAQRGIELGTVTAVATNEGATGDHTLQVNVRLRGSALELQRVPVAIGRLGVSVAPRVGDLAVLACVGGDLNAAVVLGFLYDDQTQPPDGKPTEIVYVVPDDADSDARRLHVELPGGNTVTVKDQQVEIAMGSTRLKIEADGAITLEAGGDISLKAKGAVSIEGSTGATLKGATVSVEGQGSTTVKGATVSVAGTLSFNPA